MADQDGNGTSSAIMRIMNNRFCATMIDGGNDVGYTMSTFDADGFTYTTQDKAPIDLDRFFFLALNLGGADANIFSVNQDTPTGGAPVTQNQTGTSFTPIFLAGIAISDDRAFSVTALTSDADNASIGIGLADDTRKFSITFHNDDAASTSDCDTRIKNDEFWSTDDELGALNVEASFTSFNSDGWTLEFTTTDTGAANKACYLAFGDVTAVAAARTTFQSIYPNTGTMI